jgi:hypothetical protein
MHAEALAWVAFYAKRVGDPARVLDLGGRDINGSPRPLFPGAEYVTLDALPGADILADAATWDPDREYDVTVCTEVFEHTPDYPAICVTAYKATRSGGWFIVTCAGTGRGAHSMYDGGSLREDEYYGNVSTAAMRHALEAAGWTVETVDRRNCDTRAFAVKP